MFQTMTICAQSSSQVICWCFSVYGVSTISHEIQTIIIFRIFNFVTYLCNVRENKILNKFYIIMYQSGCEITICVKTFMNKLCYIIVSSDCINFLVIKLVYSKLFSKSWLSQCNPFWRLIWGESKKNEFFNMKKC